MNTAKETSLSDLKQSALEHYEEASTAIQYDTEFADTEVEAMETAKRNFKARKKLNDEETI